MTIRSPLNKTQPSPAHHDTANTAIGFRFVRALAVEKAALDPRLAPSEVRVLAAISYFMNSITMRAWPSYRTISEIVGYTDDVIERAIKNLIAYRYIFREPHRRAPAPGMRAVIHYGLHAVSFDDIEAVIAAAVAQIKKNEEQKSGRSRLIPLRKSASDEKLIPTKRSGSEVDPDILIAADPDHSIVRNPGEEPSEDRRIDRGAAENDFLVSEFCDICSAWTKEGSLPQKRRTLIESSFKSVLNNAASAHDVDISLVKVAAASTILDISANLSDGRIKSSAFSALLKYFRQALDGEIRRRALGQATFKAAARSEQMVQEEKHRRRIEAVTQRARNSRPSTEEMMAHAFPEAGQ
jgi:hypothetical protein